MKLSPANREAGAQGPPTARSSRSPQYRAALAELAALEKSDLDPTLDAIIAADAAALGIERVSFWSLVENRSAISCRTLFVRSTGEHTHEGKLCARDFPRYFAAMLENAIISAPDAWTDPRTAEFTDVYFRPNGIVSMLDVPVWYRGELAGVVCHEQVGEKRFWTDEEEDFALSIGELVGTALEASERRRAEERLRLVARATNDVLWDWDFVLDRLDWNEALYETFRFSRAQVGQSVQFWIDHIHPHDRERVVSGLHRVLDGREESWSDEYRFVRGDGTLAFVLDRGFVQRDEGGRATRMVGSMLDITARRELEARLTISDRMATVGTMAAGVAHEINNPLAYIIGNLNHAIRELEEGRVDRAELLDELRESREGAERVGRIVRDLRVFSRPDEADCDQIDVTSVIESSINMSWNEIRHRARLVKDYAPLPFVRGNESRLGQVVLNLLVNAAQSIPEGSASTNEIRVHTHTDDAGRVVIEVRDSGSGMTADVQRRIFDPFFSTKPIGMGTGLGLSISRAIVLAMNGELTVESEPGRGSVFRCLLPGASVSLPVVAKVDDAPTRRARVLVIDDDVRVGQTIRRMLHREHTVEVTTSARAALARFAAGERFDVTLCDLMMPDMTGVDFWQSVAEVDPRLRQTIVFVTGGAFTERAREFLHDNTVQVLEKPLDLATLRKAIRSLAA